MQPSRRSTTASAHQRSTKSIYSGYEGRGTTSSSYSASSVGNNRYKNDYRESGVFENQSVQELEQKAVRQAEETTQKINGCLKIAEDMREVSSRTLENLHHQGEQITRTHSTAVKIDHDLSRGEKLLGSLGGLFFKTWKPKKNRQIKGPVLSRDYSFTKRGNHMEKRQMLGLDSSSRPRSTPRQFLSQPSSALERVEMEKLKQDDALSDLSNLLGELKAMAANMGYEIERHNKALDPVLDDVEELNFRVGRANVRTRHLLGR